MKAKYHFSSEAYIVLLCIFSITIVYWHDFAILLDDTLRNDMASYIMALPFLIFYMVYRKRDILKVNLFLENEKAENRYLKDLIGFSLCLSALFIYVYGSFKFNVFEYHLTSLLIFTSGCLVLLLGVSNLKNIIFPLGFLLLLIIPYREEAYQVGAQLSILTSTVTFNLFRILGYPVNLSSDYEAPAIMIGTLSGEQVPFVIDIPCAGAYSLIGFLIFSLFFAYLSHGSGLKKITWLLLGSSLMYSINIARITMILLVGYWFGAETAMGLFHLLSGSVLIFSVAVLMVLIGERFLKVRLFRNQKTSEEICPLCEENRHRNKPFCSFCGKFFNPSGIILSKTDLGKILILSFLLASLINLQVPSFALAQQNFMELDIHELTGSKETLEFLPIIEEYEPKFIYRDQNFERISQQDASLLYVYCPQNVSHAPLFVSVEIADSYSKLHRWEICLYIVPSEQGRQVVNPIMSKDIQILENPPLIGRLFTFKYVNSNQTVTILYWYEKMAFKIGSSWGNRYVKTSIIAYIDNFVRTDEIKGVSEYAKLENKLISKAQEIVEYWKPVQAWSTFVIAFAHWGQTLAIVTIIAASFSAAILYVKKLKDQGRMAYSIYKQLTWYSTFSKEDKEIQKVLEVLAEEKLTGVDLAETYKRKDDKKIEPAKLTRIIQHLEETGLIKKEITIKDGKPKLSWRTLII